MLKNKFAIKLSLYFAVALLVFSVVIGGIFIILLKNHTVKLGREQMADKAGSIASTLSGYMEEEGGTCCGKMGHGGYFHFIGDIAGTDVWIIDKERNLVTSGTEHDSGHMKHTYSYSDLPDNAEILITDVFNGNTVFSEDFSGLFSESTLTIGAPIKEHHEQVIGVVLLHSPVRGINGAIFEGVGLLAISIGIALIAAILFSIWLSKHFTDPIASKEAKDALRLEKIRSEFVANISHELKTPITVIRGSLEALVEKVVTDPVQIEYYYEQMLTEAAFLQRLVGDLLDLSKLQNMDFVIEKEYISFYELLQDTARSIAQVANKKGVKLNISGDSSACMICGDYGRIRQMLMIILDNAVKFSPDNGVVDIELKNKTLSVRDYGTGISKSDLPFIFDRFYKSRSEQNKQGTGLGLAIAKQIANRHNIELQAHSDEGNGAEFIFKLP